MDNIKLSNRLQAIAAFVSPGANVADIGTDHGYIPVWLAQNRIAHKIVAADINKGPLEHAKATANDYNVTEHIHFELCDGLNFPHCGEYDTIIIAGMGGELICSILEAAPWTKNDTTLILQPNSKISDLVQWLIENGYKIKQAKLVKDAGKFYQVMVVCAGQSAMIHKESGRLIHNLYFSQQDPLLLEYIDSLLLRYKAAEKGMRMGKSPMNDLARIQLLINDLEEMKKEAKAWQL